MPDRGWFLSRPRRRRILKGKLVSGKAPSAGAICDRRDSGEAQGNFQIVAFRRNTMRNFAGWLVVCCWVFALALVVACGDDDDEGPYCGDGKVKEGVEQCDDGNLSNNDACLDSCVNASCGDGFVQESVEACDDGNFDDNDACLNTCALAKCGDGVVLLGVEACDDGNSDDEDGCRRDCALPSCGDGVVQEGEECDDGNLSDADACLTTCLEATCGDGFVQEDEEECDDGNTSDADGCVEGCKRATCGDGFVWSNVEACDDGNTDDTDGCTGACELARCGDGLMQEDAEECDDGNQDNTDACLTTCLEATCGDGFVQEDEEECDDGNTLAGDWCDGDCQKECADGLLGDAARLGAGGNCYLFFETPLSWEDARAACNVIGSYLVSIADESENDEVDSLFTPDPDDIAADEAWIGLTDQYGEGTFLWAEGVGQYRSLTWESWDTDQPDDNDVEGADCASLAEGGLWSDQDCTEARAYVCEHAW